MNLVTLLFFASIMRFVLGLAPIFAAGLTSKLLGFPPEQDNPTARLMARLFGVRDIGLGAIVLANLNDPVALRKTLWLNLCMDLGDATMIAIPLVKKQGINKAAKLSLFAALSGASVWVISLYWSSPT